MFTTTIFREKTLNDAEQPVAADGRPPPLNRSVSGTPQG
jgi:hypothetical protein